MSPASSKRSVRTHRRPAQAARRRGGVKRRSPRPKTAGLLPRVGRWLLGSLLLAVLLLFLASAFGWLQIGPRRRGAEPTVHRLANWEVPPTPLPPGGLRLSPSAEQAPQGLAQRVLGWASETLSNETLGPSSGPGAMGAAQTAQEALDGDLRQTRVFLANGCGVDRLAASLCEPLRAAGFDVCGVANADRPDYSETLIVDRCGTDVEAQAVCAYFRERWGVGRVLRQARLSPVADVLVILGRDLADRQPPGVTDPR